MTPARSVRDRMNAAAGGDPPYQVRFRLRVQRERRAPDHGSQYYIADLRKLTMVLSAVRLQGVMVGLIRLVRLSFR